MSSIIVITSGQYCEEERAEEHDFPRRTQPSLDPHGPYRKFGVAHIAMFFVG
jgi:hypothetical protein